MIHLNCGFGALEMNHLNFQFKALGWFTWFAYLLAGYWPALDSGARIGRLKPWEDLFDYGVFSVCFDSFWLPGKRSCMNQPRGQRVAWNWRGTELCKFWWLNGTCVFYGLWKPPITTITVPIQTCRLFTASRVRLFCFSPRDSSWEKKKKPLISFLSEWICRPYGVRNDLLDYILIPYYTCNLLLLLLPYYNSSYEFSSLCTR
jgi:hypothetical protein